MARLTHTLAVQATACQCKLHRRPDPVDDPVDVSLLSTILLVVALAVGGAFFIMMMACLLSSDYNYNVVGE